MLHQMKLGEECNSLHATVSQLKHKLESCQKKLEATEHELAEKECQAVEYCNTLEVRMFLFVVAAVLSFTFMKCGFAGAFVATSPSHLSSAECSCRRRSLASLVSGQLDMTP